MRCYHFGNCYMSSIQQGIQAAHCQMELFAKYQDTGINFINDYEPSIEEYEYQQKVDDLYDWAENHKTMICLSAGNNSQLKEIEELFRQKDNKYPWSYFKEDEDSLGGILTNVAIVLPPEIYDTASKIRSGEYMLCGNAILEKPIKEFLTIGCSPALQTPNRVMTLTDFEIGLIKILNSCQLAR